MRDIAYAIVKFTAYLRELTIPLAIMSGIYIHIPFCKQACHYCDFHFSTSLQNKSLLIDSLLKEIIFRKDYLPDNKIETIYFGGGTPSLLSADEINKFFETLQQQYIINLNAEITLEANPDDLTTDYLKELKHTPINRLSIGIQSFRDEDLKWMNRAHTAFEAKTSVLNAATAGFENISIDLIYGLPELTPQAWMENVKQTISLPVNHLSCYCLTIEPRTVLAHQIKKGMSKSPDDDASIEQFEFLMQFAAENKFEHYEISNFGKQGYYSQHNTSYWKGIPYLGIGPSAHSFDGTSRQWNISNNQLYIKSLESGELNYTKETLTTDERYNEYVLTSLRTSWGISMDFIKNNFGEKYFLHLMKEMENYLASGELIIINDKVILTNKGKFIADGIASDLFI